MENDDGAFDEEKFLDGFKAQIVTGERVDWDAVLDAFEVMEIAGEPIPSFVRDAHKANCLDLIGIRKSRSDVLQKMLALYALGFDPFQISEALKQPASNVVIGINRFIPLVCTRLPIDVQSNHKTADFRLDFKLFQSRPHRDRFPRA